MNFLAFIGRNVLGFLREFGKITILFLNVVKYLPRIFKDRKIVVKQMAIIGADSLPLVILIGVFTGAIAALQATLLFSKFNLISIAKPFIGASIATVVFTELTPVLIALVIAGRIGASMAAQLGTMKVTEQIDALEMMAIDKDRYLAMPRVVGALAMMPVLAVFSNFVALGGAFALTAIKFDFSSYVFFNSVAAFFETKELWIGISKAFLFGGLTALIGCHVGFSTRGGAEGVGAAAVRAFTLSAAAILIVDALFGVAT